MGLYQMVSPEFLRDGPPPGAVIVDVRGVDEHAQARLCCDHVLVPLDRLCVEALEPACPAGAGTPLYLLCRGDARARRAAEMLAGAGFDNLHVVEGGIMACYDVGIPLTAG